MGATSGSKTNICFVRWRSNLVHTAKQAIAPDTCAVFTICVTALPLTPIGSVAVGDEDTIHGSENSNFGGREEHVLKQMFLDIV